MSACLFTMNNKWWDTTPIDEIKQAMKHWQQVVTEFENNIDNQRDNKFYCDQWRASETNLERGFFFFKGYERIK